MDSICVCALATTTTTMVMKTGKLEKILSMNIIAEIFIDLS